MQPCCPFHSPLPALALHPLPVNLRPAPCSEQPSSCHLPFESGLPLLKALSWLPVDLGTNFQIFRLARMPFTSQPGTASPPSTTSNTPSAPATPARLPHLCSLPLWALAYLFLEFPQNFLCLDKIHPFKTWPKRHPLPDISSKRHLLLHTHIEHRLSKVGR